MFYKFINGHRTHYFCIKYKTQQCWPGHFDINCLVIYQSLSAALCYWKTDIPLTHHYNHNHSFTCLSIYLYTQIHTHTHTHSHSITFIITAATTRRFLLGYIGSSQMSASNNSHRDHNMNMCKMHYNCIYISQKNYNICIVNCALLMCGIK